MCIHWHVATAAIHSSTAALLTDAKHVVPFLALTRVLYIPRQYMLSGMRHGTRRLWSSNIICYPEWDMIHECCCTAALTVMTLLMWITTRTAARNANTTALKEASQNGAAEKRCVKVWYGHIMNSLIPEQSSSRAYHLFEKMDDMHCIRDKGNKADQWLIGADWRRVRVRVIPTPLVPSVCQPFSGICGKLPSLFTILVVLQQRFAHQALLLY